MQAPETPGALGHLKILDLSRILAGPWATQTLADLGADVIKVENPNGGDDTRRWGPPFTTNPDGANGDAAYFTACNRNKKSVTIDFSKPEGAELVRRLARDCDVVVENFKVGGLKKYGLDYDSLKAENSGLVYCSISGFGQDGPYAHRAGYDFMIQGMGGLMSVTGQPDDNPGAGPVKVGVAVCDLFTGMYASVSILAAIAHRDKTGEGQHIDCSLLDSQVSMLANQAANWLVGGMVPTRMGNNHPNVVPYRVYPTSDGHVIVTCGNDGQFQRLCQGLDAPDLADDPRFASNAERIANRDELDQRITGLLSQRTRQDVIAILESVNVPCGPINELPDVFADPQVQARGREVAMQRPDGTNIPTVAYPATLGATPATYRTAPPSLGGDTETVLAERLGIGPEGISDLRARDIV